MSNIIDINDVILESGMATEMIDYTELAMASLVETLEEYNKLEMFELIRESEWVQDCLESGFVLPIMVPLFEAEEEASPAGATASADDADDGQRGAKQWNARDIGNAIKLWMDKLVTKINQMAIKRSRKYVPWVVDVKSLLIPGAKRIPAGNNIKMTPYYDGKWKEDVGVCTDAFSKIIRSIQAKNYRDFSFASAIVDPSDVAARTSNVSNYIKNYFRYGLKNTLDIKTEVLTGDELSSKYINVMVDYLVGYEKDVIDCVNKISKAYNPNKVQSAAKTADSSPEPAKESLYYTPDTRLSIEDRLISESMLSTLINYNQFVMEYSPGTADGQKGSNMRSSDEIKQIQELDKKRREAGGNRDDSKVTVDKDKDGNIKEVEVVDDKGKEVDTKDATTKEKGTSSALADYMRSVEYFVKLVITGYATACDERFITYLSVLKLVAKYADIPTPKFDANGNYEKTTVRKATDTGRKAKAAVQTTVDTAKSTGSKVRKKLRGKNK